MSDLSILRGLCLNEHGQPKSKSECRAAIINHLILEDMMDIDAAEDHADKTLREVGFWPDDRAALDAQKLSTAKDIDGMTSA